MATQPLWTNPELNFVPVTTSTEKYFRARISNVYPGQKYLAVGQKLLIYEANVSYFSDRLTAPTGSLSTSVSVAHTQHDIGTEMKGYGNLGGWFNNFYNLISSSLH